MLTQDGLSGDGVASYCMLNDKHLPRVAQVVVVRVYKCTGILSKSFYEVRYGKDTYFVSMDGLRAIVGSLDTVDTHSDAEIEQSMNAWEHQALQLWSSQMGDALKSVKATSSYGVALVSSSIYDVSEYTEGTGFRVKLANTGKKTIKYVTVSLVGLNAVNDPVRDRLGRSTLVTVRGIGPIAPDETASYSKDYLWMTDAVEHYDIKSIKLEYMDGTSKVVSAVKSVRLAPSTVSLIFNDD